MPAFCIKFLILRFKIPLYLEFDFLAFFSSNAFLDYPETLTFTKMHHVSIKTSWNVHYYFNLFFSGLQSVLKMLIYTKFSTAFGIFFVDLMKINCTIYFSEEMQSLLKVANDTRLSSTIEL
jgi:hypothetical protein